MNKYLARIPLGEFKKNVLVLISGTTLAQAIPIAISPILSRIYSPDNFGLLGIYMAVCTLMSVIATGRFDLAIIEPKYRSEAQNLMYGSIGLSLLFCLVMFLVVLAFNSQIAFLLGNQDISTWLYLAPVTGFTLSCYSIFTYWLNREKRFKDMSINRVINSSSNTILSLGFGLLRYKDWGLITGYAFGQIFTVSLLWKKIIDFPQSISYRRILVTLGKYTRYPKFLVPSTFAGEAAAHVPIILLTSFFSSSISGFLLLTNRVTILPMSLIGNAIGEVYRQKAAEEYSEKGECRGLFLKILLVLFLLGLVPFALLYFFGEPLFVFVFGEDWLVSGKIAKYTSFLVFFQFLSTPLSYTIVFNQSQKYDMYLQFMRAFLAVFSILIGYYYSDYILGIIFYSISYCIYYFSHTILQYRAACGHK